MPDNRYSKFLVQALDKAKQGDDASDFTDFETLALIEWLNILKDTPKHQRPPHHAHVKAIVMTIVDDINEHYAEAETLTQDDIDFIKMFGELIVDSDIENFAFHEFKELHSIALGYDEQERNQEEFFNQLDDLADQCELDDESIQVLKILSKDEMTKDDVKYLTQYLDSLEKPLALNKTLKEMDRLLAGMKISKPLKNHYVALQIAIDDLMRVTYKSRHADYEQFERLENLMETSRNLKKTVDDEAKLTLYEASVVSDMASLSSIMNKWFANTEDEDKPIIARYAALAQDFTSTLEQHQVAKAKKGQTLYAFINSAKVRQIEGKADTRLDRLFTFAVRKITDNYEHTSSLHVDDSDTFVEKHLTRAGVRSKGTMDFSSQLYNDMYVFDVSKLVSKRNAQVLEVLYTDQWPQVLNALYSEYERQAHDDALFKGLKLTPNVKMRTYTKAGLESMFLHGPMSKQHKDVDAQRDKALLKHNKRNQTPMLCSQYTAYTTLMAIDRLNQAIEDMAATHNMSNPDDKVSFHKEPISPPISKRQRMNMMHPGEFFAQLQKKGCVKLLENKKAQKYIRS